MNFFDLQIRARRRTGLYVLLFTLATIAVVAGSGFVIVGLVYYLFECNFIVLFVTQFAVKPMSCRSFAQWIIADPRLFYLIVFSSLLLVAGDALLCWRRLRQGSSIAQQFGGVLIEGATQDLRERQLLNVIEETAIAVGLPIPRIYVLDGENGINAYAAGYDASDAAIAVTRGALKYLTRDELQAMVAHEFSHVLNGDMRLNTHLISALHGVMAFWLVGKSLVGDTGPRDEGENPAPAVFGPIGYALMLNGYIGIVVGSLIQAAVARSCERLADASAIQFTRQPGALASALKKIAVLGAQLRAPGVEVISHMLAAEPVRQRWLWFSTHPPLLERIRVIEPNFQLDDLKNISPTPVPVFPTFHRPAPAVTEPPFALVDDIVATIGLLTGGALVAAAARRAAIPSVLMSAAHTPSDAAPLLVALALGDNIDEASRRLDHTFSVPGLADASRDSIERFAADVSQLDRALRLPLVEMAIPALRQRSNTELRALVKAIDEVARSDKHISVFQYALIRLIRLRLYEAIAPAARNTKLRTPQICSLRPEIQALFSIVARAARLDPNAASSAYENGVQRVIPESAPPYKSDIDWHIFDRALDQLDLLRPTMKQTLIEALLYTVSQDGRINVAEAELLRVICASLHSALPPTVSSAIEPLLREQA